MTFNILVLINIYPLLTGQGHLQNTRYKLSSKLPANEWHNSKLHFEGWLFHSQPLKTIIKVTLPSHRNSHFSWHRMLLAADGFQEHFHTCAFRPKTSQFCWLWASLTGGGIAKSNYKLVLPVAIEDHITASSVDGRWHFKFCLHL